MRVICDKTLYTICANPQSYDACSCEGLSVTSESCAKHGKAL